MRIVLVAHAMKVDTAALDRDRVLASPAATKLRNRGLLKEVLV